MLYNTINKSQWILRNAVYKIGEAKTKSCTTKVDMMQYRWLYTRTDNKLQRYGKLKQTDASEVPKKYNTLHLRALSFRRLSNILTSTLRTEINLSIHPSIRGPSLLPNGCIHHLFDLPYRRAFVRRRTRQEEGVARRRLLLRPMQTPSSLRHVTMTHLWPHELGNKTKLAN